MTAPSQAATPAAQTPEERANDALYQGGVAYDIPVGQMLILGPAIAAAIRAAEVAKVSELTTERDKLREALGKVAYLAKVESQRVKANAFAVRVQDTCDAALTLKLPSPEKGRESKAVKSDTDATKEGT